MPNDVNEAQLPPPPAPEHWYYCCGEAKPTDGYTLEQMYDYARAALAFKPPAREAATAYVPLHVLEALRAGCKVATTLTPGKDADHTEAVQLVSDNH